MALSAKYTYFFIIPQWRKIFVRKLIHLCPEAGEVLHKGARPCAEMSATDLEHSGVQNDLMDFELQGQLGLVNGASRKLDAKTAPFGAPRRSRAQNPASKPRF